VKRAATPATRRRFPSNRSRPSKTMSIEALLGQMESVEDIFTTLEVSYDSRVVSTHRIRILRRFGREFEAIRRAAEPHSEAELRARCTEAIKTIYEQCERGMREPEPVFIGHAPQLVQLRRGPTRDEPHS